MHGLERDVELRAELLRKRLIAVCLRATDAVMDMHRPQRKVHPGLQRVQRIQQEDRIGTTRKADHDAVARTDQLIRPDISFDFQHKRIHAKLLSSENLSFFNGVRPPACRNCVGRRFPGKKRRWRNLRLSTSFY